MTSSASSRGADGDRLARTLELYRDLTMALRDRITVLSKPGTDAEAPLREALRVVRDHHMALRTVLDIEEGLKEGSKADVDGGGAYDLDAARAEILARLAVWNAEG